jgi:hypothetical protein
MEETRVGRDLIEIRRVNVLVVVVQIEEREQVIKMIQNHQRRGMWAE